MTTQATSLQEEDFDLIRRAQREFEKELSHDWHGVACALRLRSGKIFTSFVLEAENPSLTICAEPMAIGKALEYIKNDPVESIVAVRKNEATEHKVIPPCGRCREFITDYAGSSKVIVFDASEDKLVKVSAKSLLPFKYERL